MAPLLVIGAAALGSAAMYYYDPDQGRRRRALMRDKIVKTSSNVREFVDDGTRDLKGRGSALTGRMKSLVTRRKGTDEVLVERVRSKMGRFVLHPGAIDVAASEGRITLTGSILAHEHDGLLEGLAQVPGVNDIVDEIGVYQTAEGISELQGGRQPRDGAGGRETNWAPGTRLIGSAAGTTLTLYAIARSNRFAGFVALMAGIALFARAATNKPLLRLAGLEAPPRDAQASGRDAPRLEGSPPASAATPVGKQRETSDA